MAKIKDNSETTNEVYELTPKYKKEEFVGTIINKRHVNLVGKSVDRIAKGRKGAAPKPYTYHAATQEDLKAFYELGLMRDADGKPIVDALGNEISNQKVVVKRTIKNEQSTTSNENT